MKKGVFIIPYFGKLPDNFELWALTASFNPEFDFWVFTDDRSHSNKYENVKLTYLSFEEFASKVQGKFDFAIGLTNVRKLCDFKPTYGFIFEEEINDYLYWGYCDIDVVLGDLSSMIPIYDDYDKLFVHGHMTLIRNNHKMNRLFQCPVTGYQDYKQLLASEDVLIFDEPSDGLNINLIAESQNINRYYDYNIADIKPYSYLFQRSLYDYSCSHKAGRESKDEGIKKQIFLWKDGQLKRYYIDADDNAQSDEMRYFHFQKRVLSGTGSTQLSNGFLIVPNKVIPFDGAVTKNIILQYTKDVLIYPQYFKLKFKNLRKKLGV